MNHDLKNGMPSSWAFASLADLGSWVGGGTPSKDNASFWTNGIIPWVSPKDMKSFEIHDTEDHITESAVRESSTIHLPAGTVLIVARSGILRHTFPVAISCISVTLNQDLKALTPHKGLLPKFIAYALRGFGQDILHTCTKDGTTVQSIELPALKRFRIPLAPINEQRRIADALDELLSDIDAGVAALERSRTNLAHYRAAVLKAAVEGALTADWRKHHLNTEPAWDLLKRILVERRKRCEQEQLRKYAAVGKQPPVDWKAKYKEPIAPDTTGLPILPEDWCWATFDMAVWDFASGSTAVPQNHATGFPILRSSSVRAGKLQLDDVKYLATPDSALISVNDLLFVRLSGSLDYVGCCAIVRTLPNASIAFPDRLFRAKLSATETGRYLELCFCSPFVRRIVTEKAKSTAGHQRISTGAVLGQPIPLPPLLELHAIVEAAEDQLSVIDHLEADLEAKLKSAQGLRQSILRHAFSGKLVPQDPTDEPASELLRRIAAERAERQRHAAAAKRTSRTTATRKGPGRRPQGGIK